MQDALRQLRPAGSDAGGHAARNWRKMESRTCRYQESPAEQKVVPKLELWPRPIGFGAVVSLCSGVRRGDVQPQGSEG